MLVITIPAGELWNEATETFSYTKETTLRLEHSLISLSKWESKWCIPFFSINKTTEQTIDYIRCMCLTPDVDPNVFNGLTQDNIKQIVDYIGAPMTATTIKESKNAKRSNEVVTSELIYYWMIQYNIPVEFEKWHLNRLTTLIRVCSEKNQPDKKMSNREIMAQNRAINRARRARLHSKG